MERGLGRRQALDSSARALLAAALLGAGLFTPGALSAQTGTVTGTVLSAETGDPLEGVQVILEKVGQEETRLSGFTGASGRFLILGVPAGQYLVRAELIGFATRTQMVDVVGGLPSLADFRLDPEPISLSEIVVTGVIGSTQRTKLPFDVVQVRVADLPVPSVNAPQSLQGKVAGVQVVQASGIPGATPSILLRGATSLTASGRSQDPLYIVDDVIVGADLVDLSALDIQSIEVVKGAAAASFYGSRAANGVIHIRTRRGAEMPEARVRYTLRSELGGSTLGRRPRGMFPQAHPYAMTPDGKQFLKQNGDPCDWLACGNAPAYAGQAKGAGDATVWNTFQTNPWPGKAYDQVERFFTNGGFQQNHLTVEGRSGTTNFLVSASYLDQGGIIRYLPGFSRANLRVNLDQAIRDDLSLNSSVFYSRLSRPVSNLERGALDALRGVAPVVDLMARDSLDPDQPVFIVGPDLQVNPLYDLVMTQQREWRARFLGSLTARYTPLDWLSLEGNFSFDRGDGKERRFWQKGYKTVAPYAYFNDGGLELRRTTTEALNGSLTASARWELRDGIRNQTQLRYLIESQDYDDFWAEGYGLAAAAVPVMTNVNQGTLLSESIQETIRADGYFILTNFDLYDRYVVDALLRNDGSSLFGKDERRQWYYRLGAAWRVSQEDFFRVPRVDELKLRYSVGTAGGRPRFSAQYETFEVTAGRVVPYRLGNRDLKPEHSTEHEAGLDLSAFDYRATLSLTYARTSTEDQILQVPVPLYTGYLSQWRNAGTVESRTFEATLDLRLLESPSFTWSAKLLFDATTSKITALNTAPFKYGPITWFYARKGEEIGAFYGTTFAKSCENLPAGMSCDGFTVNDEGYLVWTGVGTSFDDPQWGTFGPEVAGSRVKWGTPFIGFCVDRVTHEQTQYCPVGKSLPDYNLGVSTTFSWNGFSAYALFSRSAGFDVRNQGWYNPGGFDQDRVPEGQRKPIGYFEEARWKNVLGVGVVDGSFTKLRELSLAYRFGRDLLGRIPVLGGVSSMTLRFSGQNLFTWSDYPGYDPDVGLGGDPTGSAAIGRIDYFSYPHMRSYTGSVEVVF